MTLHYSYRYTPPENADNAAGAAAPPRVVLLHGLFGSAANLGMVARGLAGEFEVYSLDLPNHGLSPRMAQMDYPTMAAAVAGFIETQQLAPCHLLGHSMGGKVAMQLALDAPDLVDKLVVSDIAPVQYPGHHDDILAGLQAVEQLAPPGRREAEQVLSRHVEDPGVRAFLLKSWHREADGSYRWLINLSAVVDNYPNLGQPIQGEPFSGPVLFIRGGDSNYIQASHREAILALFPAAQVKTLEGTGHWLHAEKPALFNSIALDFLRA